MTKKFGGLVALNNVSFEIYENEIVGLIGPNGAGKSTLFNVITGIYRPDSGEILFNGNSITGLKPHQICKQGIARNFQVERLFKKLSVLENVMLGSAFGNPKFLNMHQAQQEASRWLKFVGLPDGDRPLSDLKSAQWKTLEIARALAMEPKLMLIDEVLAGLNPKEVLGNMELIEKCRKERGITIFWIEHVMKGIMEVADRIIVLHHGIKIGEGKPIEIANDKKIIDVYLGTKYA